MKFRIDKTEFLKGLQKTQGIVEKRTTMPILSNLLLRAGDGGIEIFATDLEVGVKDFINADIIEEGGITTGAKKLYEIVRELPEDLIEINTHEEKEEKLKIRSGKAVFNLIGTPEEDFPSFPEYSKEDVFNIAPQTLSDMIEKTIFSISTDETRYNISGVYIETEGLENGNLLKMVSTDGHRLSLINKEIEDINNLKGGVIIPKKGVYELRKIIADNDIPVNICITENNIIFRQDTTVLAIRLIDGEFPDYKQIVPQGNDKRCIINKDIFLSVLKRISILSTERSKGIKLSLFKDRMVISSNNPDLGEAEEDIDIEYNNEEMEIGFNARYLIEPLSIIDGEQVSIEIKDNVSPVVLKPLTGSDESLFIIMPMRLI